MEALKTTSIIDKKQLTAEEFSQWVTSHYKKLFQLAEHQVKTIGMPSDLAEDIVQESLLYAFRNLANYHPEKTLMAWMVFIIKNKAIDFIRKRKGRTNRSIKKAKREEVPFTELLSSRDSSFEKGIITISHEEPPVENAIASELRDIIAENLKNLPSREKMVLSAHMNGLPDSAIADGMSIKKITASIHLLHARNRLAKLLYKKGYDVPSRHAT